MYRVRAPDLAPYAAWINTARPLSIKDLRGQLVVLDFWTYCCVNCMHVQPILRDLERRHRADPLMVIGVHSAKFDAEGDPARIENAVQRYGIEHPVVVDRDMAIWQAFAVRSWPTLVFVKPDGTLAAVAPGEPDADILERFVSEQLAEARANGTLADAPLDSARLSEAPRTPMAFPGKVAIAPDGRIAVSDSGHHRVLVAQSDGTFVAAIGSGLRGHLDGSFEQAAFDDPQGIAWDDEALWICDTRNHQIRRADLLTREVTTFAGTGAMAPGLHQGSAAAASIALRSPWDLVVSGRRLLVAMAGSHQIWSMGIDDGEAAPFAGSGREALIDGALAESAFAQPSGLALDAGTLYVADSETSAVRAIDLAQGRVETLVGEGLFDFGDADGAARTARMQHPLDVAVAMDGAVIVADTYNDRLRRIDRVSERVGTFYRGEDEQALDEPAGIAADPVRGGFLVADTDNHRLVRIADDGSWMGEFVITSIPPPARGDVADRVEAVGANGAADAAAWYTASLEPDAGDTLDEGEVIFSLTLDAPDGWKIAPGTPARLRFEVSRRSDLLSLTDSEVSTTAPARGDAVVMLEGNVAKLPARRIDSELLITLDVVVCARGDAAVCIPARGWYRLPLTLERGGDRVLGYRLPVPSPRAIEPI